MSDQRARRLHPVRYSGEQREVGRADAAAVLGPQLEPDRLPAHPITQQLAFPRREQPFGAPQPQGEEHRAEFPPLVGQDVFAPGPTGAGDLLEDAPSDELLEPIGENVAGGAEALLEFAETAFAHQRVAHDQERPPFADALERARDRTRRTGQTLALHEATPGATGPIDRLAAIRREMINSTRMVSN